MKIALKTVGVIAVSVTILIVAFFWVPTFSQSNKQLKAMTNEAQRITGDKFKYVTKSPKGVRIISVAKPSADMMNAIDTGFDELFSIAKKKPYQYKKKLNFSDYTIYIANADRVKDSGGNYSPDIAVAANQYAGSVYDKGGYIYAAGMVVTFNPLSFVVANHTKNFERVSNVVRFEGEHLVLYHNDRKLFEETADHSKGGGHPILK
ncbi:MAG: hypothetical protein ACK5NT_02405 [Pyrinomonadaceae bacterium]